MPEQAEELIQNANDFVALGHQLILDPNCVEKVISGHEDLIRYNLHAADLEDLGIKPPIIIYISGMPGLDIQVLIESPLQQIDNINFL